MPLLIALVGKEFQTWLQDRVVFALLTAIALVLALMVLVVGLVILAPEASVAPTFIGQQASTLRANLIVANRAPLFFGSVGACVLLAGGMLAPAVAASAFAQERERGTLDLLLLQGPSTILVVIGKVVAAVAFSLLVLLMGAPLFAPAWSFGGVSGGTVAVMAVLLAAQTLLLSSIGVFCGAIVRRSLPAALLAQALAFVLLIGTLGAFAAGSTLGQSGGVAPLLWLNPLVVLFSAEGSATASLMPLLPTGLHGILALPVLPLAPGVSLEAWQIAVACWAMVAAILMAATAVVLDPLHPLRPVRRSP